MTIVSKHHFLKQRNDTLNSGQVITYDQTAIAVNKNSRKSNGDVRNREVGETDKVKKNCAVEQL